MSLKEKAFVKLLKELQAKVSGIDVIKAKVRVSTWLRPAPP